MATHQPLQDGRYDSVTDFIAAVNLRCFEPKNREHFDGLMTETRYGKKWFGADCANGRDVERVMNSGWKEGQTRMEKMRSKIGNVELVPIDRRRRPVRTDMGDIVDMPSVWSGRLDIAWKTAKRRTTQGPQKIELCANMLCSGGEDADVLFWRGAAAATLADILEQAGYMVRLVIAFGGKEYTNGDVSCRIIVKDHGMPLDVATTSAVILPGFFRALGHAWIVNHSRQHIGYFGGITVEQGKVDEGEIFLSHEVRDQATAAKFVTAQIQKLNDSIMGGAAA